MFRRTQNLVLGRALQDAIVDALSAAPLAELLDAADVILFTDVVSPTPTLDPADLTAPTFTGYAPVVLTIPLLGPVNLDGGIGRAGHQEVNFAATAAPESPQIVRGYAVTNGDQTVLYAAEQFAEPVTFEEEGDFLSLDIIFPIPNQLSAE